MAARKVAVSASWAVSAITETGRTGTPRRRRPSSAFRYSAAPSGWQALPISEPPPPVTQRLLIGACVPEWLSSPTSRSIGPPEAVKSRRAFWIGGRVDPVLRVAEPHPRRGGGGQHLVGAGQRARQHLLARGVGRAEEPGERLLHDHVLARAGRLDRHRRVEMGRHAEIHQVHLRVGEHRGEIGDRARHPELPRVGPGPLGPRRGHARELDVHPAHVPVRLAVDVRHEARAHDAHPHSRS